jgi:hypothetical protein
MQVAGGKKNNFYLAGESIASLGNQIEAVVEENINICFKGSLIHDAGNFPKEDNVLLYFQLSLY